MNKLLIILIPLLFFAYAVSTFVVDRDVYFDLTKTGGLFSWIGLGLFSCLYIGGGIVIIGYSGKSILGPIEGALGIFSIICGLTGITGTVAEPITHLYNKFYPEVISTEGSVVENCWLETAESKELLCDLIGSKDRAVKFHIVDDGVTPDYVDLDSAKFIDKQKEIEG